MACHGAFVKACERRLQELGRDGRLELHHGSVAPDEWYPGLREYWNAMLDCVIEDWPRASDG